MVNISEYQALTAEIIRLLREERKRREISNYEIAKRSGVSQPMLSLVERGLRNPTLELMLRISDAIGIELGVVIQKARKLRKKNPKKSK